MQTSFEVLSHWGAHVLGQTSTLSIELVCSRGAEVSAGNNATYVHEESVTLIGADRDCGAHLDVGLKYIQCRGL